MMITYAFPKRSVVPCLDQNKSSRKSYQFILLSLLMVKLARDLARKRHLDPRRDLNLSVFPHILVGSRVWLRAIFPTDWEQLLENLNPSIKKKYSSGLSPEVVKNNIYLQANNNLKSYCNSFEELGTERFDWVVINHSGIAGKITIFSSEVLDYVEIAFSGGLGSKSALKLVLDYMENKKFLATVHPQNSLCIKILRELGFVEDHTRKEVSKYGSVRDHYLFNRDYPNECVELL